MKKLQKVSCFLGLLCFFALCSCSTLEIKVETFNVEKYNKAIAGTNKVPLKSLEEIQEKKNEPKSCGIRVFYV